VTPVPPPPRPRPYDVALTAAMHGLVAPFGADVEVGARVARGRLGGSARVRATVPQAAGGGRFQQTSLLAGVGWRRHRGRWELGAEMRAGAMVVSGIGFDDNHAGWLPWWEVAVGGGRRFGWGTLGVEVAGTALQHRAVTADRLVAEDIAPFRAGVAGTWELFE
jgi:hypothetical protein